jgi:amino acid permease
MKKGIYYDLFKGSLRGSIFVLMSVAMGAGMLALPSLFRDSGVIAAIFFIFFGGYLSYQGL